MKIGVKHFTYAKYVSGGAGSAVTYSGGTMTTDKTVHVDYTVERDDQSFYADDHRIEHSNTVTGCSVTIELATLTAAMMKDILGWQQVGSTDVYQETGDEAPYVGCGWAVPVKEDGSLKYRGVWVYKVQFGLDSDSVNTKGQNLEYQTETITGAGMAVTLASGGSDVYRAVMTAGASLAAVDTWLNTQAGISSGGP